MENVNLYKNLEKVLAQGDECQEHMTRHARVLASAAQARLARHHKTGTHGIVVRKGDVDHFINLEGPAALSVEVGHIAPNGEFVEGLHIVGGLT